MYPELDLAAPRNATSAGTDAYRQERASRRLRRSIGCRVCKRCASWNPLQLLAFSRRSAARPSRHARARRGEAARRRGGGGVAVGRARLAVASKAAVLVVARSTGAARVAARGGGAWRLRAARSGAGAGGGGGGGAAAGSRTSNISDPSWRFLMQGCELRDDQLAKRCASWTRSLFTAPRAPRALGLRTACARVYVIAPIDMAELLSCSARPHAAHRADASRTRGRRRPSVGLRRTAGARRWAGGARRSVGVRPRGRSVGRARRAVAPGGVAAPRPCPARSTRRPPRLNDHRLFVFGGCGEWGLADLWEFDLRARARGARLPDPPSDVRGRGGATLEAAGGALWLAGGFAGEERPACCASTARPRRGRAARTRPSGCGRARCARRSRPTTPSSCSAARSTRRRRGISARAAAEHLVALGRRRRASRSPSSSRRPSSPPPRVGGRGRGRDKRTARRPCGALRGLSGDDDAPERLGGRRGGVVVAAARERNSIHRRERERLGLLRRELGWQVNNLHAQCTRPATRPRRAKGEEKSGARAQDPAQNGSLTRGKRRPEFAVARPMPDRRLRALHDLRGVEPVGGLRSRRAPPPPPSPPLLFLSFRARADAAEDRAEAACT